jgi:Domain of unknown function (DUF5668)
MSRNRALTFPLALIAIGVIVLLANTGVLSEVALNRLADLWPLLLVIVGLQLILNHTLPRRQATAIGLGVIGVIVIAALAYATLAPSTALGARQADYSSGLGGLKAATLDLDYSAAQVDVRAGSSGDLLYQAHVEYPGGENPPTVTFDHEKGTVSVHESGSLVPFHLFGSNRRHLTMTLNSQIPWAIQLSGGAANLQLNFSGMQVSKLDVSGGANRLDARLPAPKGTVVIDMSGGLSNLTLRAPAETQWRVSVDGGASAIKINGSTSGALGGNFQRESPGYGSATDRYDIEISGGASHVDFRTGG